MSQRLIYVMDPMCSWCWGFAPVIDAIVELAPTLPIHFVAGGLRPGQRDQLDERTREVLAEHWEAVAIASSQPFISPSELPDGFVYDTEPACRALVAGRELDADKVWPLVKSIQHALYVQGEDVVQVSTLLRLAEEAGYDRMAFGERYDSTETRAAVAADFSWAADLGFSGFPTLLAQRDGLLALLANGYQSADSVLPLLERWLAAGEGMAQS